MYLSGKLHQLTDPVCGNRAVQERRDDGHHVAERRGQLAPLLQEQSHRSIGNIICPQPEQTVPECQKLHQRSHHRHQDIGLDGKHIIFQADITEFSLPPAHLLTVMRRDPEGLDGIKIVNSLYLKGHKLGAHFPDLLAVVPLLPDHKSGHQEHKRRTAERNDRHDPVIVQDHKKGGDKVIDCNNNGRKPADGIAADRADISIETVQDISIGILVQCQPVRIHDLIKDIRLDIIVDINAELGRDPADHAAKYQAEHGTSHHDSHHDPESAGIMAGNDVDHILAGHAADQSHRGTEDTKNNIEYDGAFIPGAIRENPLPVVDDLSEGSVLPPGYEDVQRFKGRILVLVLIFFVHVIFLLCLSV